MGVDAQSGMLNGRTRAEGRGPTPTRRAALERRAAHRRLPTLTYGLAVAYAIFTPLPLMRGGLARGGVLAAISIAGVIAMVRLRRTIVAGRLPHRQAHTAMGLSLALLALRALMGWAVFGTGDQIAFLSVVILTVGYTCVSLPWTWGLFAAVELGWVTLAWLLGIEWPNASLALYLLGAVPIALMMRHAGLTTLWHEDERQVRDRVRRVELGAAMARASESERRFRGIFERINDVYLRVGLDGRIEMISPSVTRFGFQPHELIGTDVAMRFAAEDVARGGALLNGGALVGDLEMRWRRRDGNEIVVSVSGNVLRDAAGAAIAYEAVLRDISERKRLEEVRQEQQAELAHVLRLGSMGEMAAELAHELTQPLAAIVNYAGACARYVRAERDERAKLLHGLELISAQGLRAGEIVRRIRSYVAKRPPQREVVDLAILVTQAAHTVATESRRVGVPIVVEGTNATWLASVDSIQIEQVVVNLLINALEAVPAPAAGDRITIAVGANTEGLIEIAVCDPGCGLGALANRIFDPFFSTKTTGLGMGLAISRSIVESHAGKLWAAPNPERGTTFRFTLPRLATVTRDDRAPATVH